MTSYSDTGFLVKLYLDEPESPRAIAVVERVRKPILISELTVLEFRNALHLIVFRNKIDAEERLSTWGDFQADLQDGIYAVRLLPSEEHYARAGGLADKHSATVGCRSLDLLHVAAAQLLNANELLSFDVRQRTVAVIEGLKVLP